MDYLEELERAKTFEEVLTIFHQACATGHADEVITEAEEALLRIEKQRADSGRILSAVQF